MLAEAAQLRPHRVVLAAGRVAGCFVAAHAAQLFRIGCGLGRLTRGPELFVQVVCRVPEAIHGDGCAIGGVGVVRAEEHGHGVPGILQTLDAGETPWRAVGAQLVAYVSLNIKRNFFFFFASFFCP